MAVTKVNARDWTVEVRDAGDTTWVEVGGLNTITFGREAAEVDTTDNDSAGADEHEVMSRGKTITIEGRFLEDTSNGTRDTGQARVETLADAVGASSLGKFRFTSPGGTAETWATASVQLGDVGGGHTDKTSWAATIKRSGASS